MTQRRAIRRLPIIFLAVQLGLWGAGMSSAHAQSWRMVTSGKLEKTVQGDGYALRGDDGEISYRIASAKNLDLQSLLGRRVQVVGKLDGAAGSGSNAIHAEKMVLVDPPTGSGSVRVADNDDGSGAGDNSVLEKVRIKPRSEPAEATTNAEPEPLASDDSAVFLNEPLNAPSYDTMPPLSAPFDPSFYQPGTPYGGAPSTSGMSHRIWTQTDLLTWWSYRYTTPTLVTTSPPGTPQEDAGVLGKPGTTVLVGEEKLFKKIRPGLRFQIGGWLGPRRRLGLEFDFAALEDESWSYMAASNGSVILARPFFNVDPALGLNQGPDSALVSYPNQIAGNVVVNATSRFRDAALLLRTPLLTRPGSCFDPCNSASIPVPGYRLDLYGGYRYYDLDESLTVDELLTFSVAPQAGQTVHDEFNTESTFNGGELGLYGEYYRGRWSLDSVFRLALGNTSQRVEINGATETSTVGIVTPFTGGLLALPTNIGTYKRNKPDLIPEFGLNLGFMLTRRLQMTAGYTIIYWPHVVRPGNQVDLVINGSYIPDPAGSPAGAPTPTFAFNDGGYWVQGFNLGLDYRW